MKEQLNPKEVAKELATGYREMTFAAISLGIVQGVILNLAFVYVGLKLGGTIGGSTVAAIMGYALLTGVIAHLPEGQPFLLPHAILFQTEID